MKHLILISILATLVALSAACEDSNNPYESSSDGDSDSDSDSDTDSDSDSDSDGDSDADTDTGTGDPICDELNFDIEVTPVRLVFLLDISGSMSGTRLNDAKAAINDILTNWGGAQIQFGFDHFPTTSGSSSIHSSIPIAPASGTESAISTMVNGLSATGTTPAYEAMNNYTNTAYATGFPEAGVESYLVFITDGYPNSGTATTFGSLASTLYNTHGIHTVAIGFDFSNSILNAIAANGGMPAPYNTSLLATDLTTLSTAFNGIAGAVVNCIYDINITNEVDYDEVNFYFVDALGTETVVPYSSDCSTGTGWHWVDELTHAQIEFCEDSCDELKDGDVEDIKGEFGCPQVIVD